MKKQFYIFSLLLVTFLSTNFAQDTARFDKINAIKEKSIQNCSEEIFGKDVEETKKNLSLYQEYYKQKAYSDALPYWRYVFFNAPKSSQNLYVRGSKMYKKLAKESEGEIQQNYYDTLFAIHETRLACFGSSAKLEKNKAFDWYSFRKKSNESFVLSLFEKTYKTYTKEEKVPPVNFLTYWVDITIRANKFDTLVTKDSVITVYTIATEIIEEQLQGENAGKAYGALEKIKEKLALNEFNIDCKQILPSIEKVYRANPKDTLTIKRTYKKLKSFSCTDSPFFMEVVNIYKGIQPSYALFIFIAKKQKDEGKITMAIESYYQALQYAENDIDKEKVLHKIAGLYYKKGNFVKVRVVANQILNLNPNSGKAYITIGRTYASSGKICGTGTDFKSHTIVWAAVDTWKKAINVDASVTNEAQTLINKYSQYMPTRKELFMEGIKIGNTYNISCFGFSTIVRASD